MHTHALPFGRLSLPSGVVVVNLGRRTSTKNIFTLTHLWQKVGAASREIAQHAWYMSHTSPRCEARTDIKCVPLPSPTAILSLCEATRRYTAKDVMAAVSH